VLLAIINDILDFSKIEAGKLTLENAPFNLEQLLEETVIVLANSAQKKGLEIFCDLDPKIPEVVFGDSVRIRQVLTNLLGNAIKFTKSGEVILTVLSRQQHDAKVILRFSVKDTGIGLSASDQKKLFQPFVQADSSTTRKYGGTGLGLTISRKLVNLMGGELKVVSQEREGSTFSFEVELPFDTGKKKENKSLNSRVLIIDDNASFCDTIKRILDSWNVRSAAAYSVNESKTFLNNTKFDSILIDHQLSVSDTSALELFQRSGAKIISMKSSVDEGDILENDNHPIVDVIIKPFRRNELWNSLHHSAGGTQTVDKTKTSDVDEKKRDAVVKKKNVNILLVEDNDVNQDVGKQMLQTLGYEADIAENGEIALQKIETKSYDLILMDCQMPVMDGYVASQCIRSLKGKNKDIPIIAMTANAFQQDIEKCRNAGMNDHISKPVKLETLRTVLDTWISKMPSESKSKSENEISSELSDTPIIDQNIIKDLLSLTGGGNTTWVEGMLRKFLASAEPIIESIGESITANKPDRLRKSAHKLKGSSGTIGAFRIMKLSETLEDSSVNHIPENGAELHQKLKSEFTNLQKYIDTEFPMKN
jgi:two-component system, sensor histidine kinase and response regulator